MSWAGAPDYAAAQLCDFICGANVNGEHLSGVNWGRDLPEPVTADIRNVVAGDASPDGKGTLSIVRGIEVGHIFQLGNKYSQAMNATVLDVNGANHVMTMGCYGIGVSRVVAAAIEQNIILDCGSKTLSSDAARGFVAAPGYGSVLASIERDEPDETLLVERLSEEHATLRVLTGRTTLEPGDRVRVLPNHACVVSNLVDEIRLVEGLRVVETIQVAARGRSRRL